MQVRRDRKLGDLNPLPFPVIMTNTLLWIAYAYHLGDWYLVFANTPGALLGVFFTLVWYVARP